MAPDDLIRWPKVCGVCERVFDARRWRELKFCGRAPLGLTTWVESRECHCGRILAVATDEEE